MRENETRIGGLQWGLFSIFEPSAPNPNRTIDQSVVAWRLASKAAGSAAFENPRSVIQRTVNMVTVGSNREHHERVRFTVNPSAALPYNREELLRWHYTPDNPIPVIPRRRAMTAGEVRARMVSEREANRREGFRYPTPEEVSEIERRFRNPELEHAMEVARQEIMRRYWPHQEYLARMARMISEPVPPEYRSAIQAAQNAD